MSTRDTRTPNVNVTLGTNADAPKRTFPCPICAARLEVRYSRAIKPYCVCNACGIQIFFRGKVGISKLREFLDRDEPASLAAAAAADSVAAFARLEQLRAQKRELEEKRPLIFADRALNDAILAIDNEISRFSERLRAMAEK